MVTHKGHSVAIYHTPARKEGKTYDGYTLVFTAASRRKRRFVADLEEARAAADGIAKQLSEGTGHMYSLSPADVADFLAAAQILRRLPRPVSMAEIAADYADAVGKLPEKVSLRDAVSSWRKHHDRQTELSIATVEQVRDRFIASREKGGASDRYLRDIRGRLKAFCGSFRCQISSVTVADIETWLGGLKVGGRSRNNYRNAIVTLFNFAKRQGYLPRDRAVEPELVDRAKPAPSEIGIYQPEELWRILAGMPEHLLPSVAVQAFGGVRTAEVFKLDWSEVDLVEGHLTITAAKAKTASRRIVPILPALAAWLKPFADRKGRVAGKFAHPTSWNRAVAREISAINKAEETHAMKNGTKPPPTLHRVPNGLRHSFASYRLAAVKSADQVALEMGNSPRKLIEHYRKLVTEEEATNWFSVMPGRQPRTRPAPPHQRTAPARRQRLSGLQR